MMVVENTAKSPPTYKPIITNFTVTSIRQHGHAEIDNLHQGFKKKTRFCHRLGGITQQQQKIPGLTGPDPCQQVPYSLNIFPSG